MIISPAPQSSIVATIPAGQQNFNEPVIYHRKQNVPGEDYVLFHAVAVQPSIAFGC